MAFEKIRSAIGMKPSFAEQERQADAAELARVQESFDPSTFHAKIVEANTQGGKMVRVCDFRTQEAAAAARDKLQKEYSPENGWRLKFGVDSYAEVSHPSAQYVVTVKPEDLK